MSPPIQQPLENKNKLELHPSYFFIRMIHLFCYFVFILCKNIIKFDIITNKFYNKFVIVTNLLYSSSV